MLYASRPCLPASLTLLLLACAPLPEEGAASPAIERCDREPVPCADLPRAATSRTEVAATPQPQPPVERTGASLEPQGFVLERRAPKLPETLWRPEWYGNLREGPQFRFTYTLPYEPEPGAAERRPP